MSPRLILLIAILGISVSGPLVRLSDASPLAIAVGRLAFSLPIIGVLLIATGGWRQWRRLSARPFMLACAAGVFLAIHFWSWNASIGLTTVAASVVLVNTQPLIVAALSAVWLREPPSRRQWAGIGIAMVGALLVVWPDLSASGLASGRARNPLLGDLLALVGAATAAAYYVCGRRLRATLDLWPYVALVYGACFVVLVVLALATSTPLLPQPPRELAIFLGLALGPMLLGHTGLNWALRYFPAYAVNLTVLGEPVFATILAALLPGIREVPGVATLAGGAVILAGIYLTTASSARNPAS